jgi:hypothetical protein
MIFTKLHRIPRKLFVGLITFLIGLIVAYIVLPCLLILICPIILYRRILFHSAKYVRPDLAKMVTARGSLPAFEDVYKSARSKLVTAVVLEGCPSLDDLRDGVESALGTVDPNSGQILYPELSQNITKWMGYLFWKPLKNFHADDHIVYCEKQKVIFEQADRLLKEESLIPFTNDKAMWKLILYTNYDPDKSDKFVKAESRYSLLVFCVHHTLVDGFSVMKLAHKVCQIQYVPPIPPQPQNSSRSYFSKLIKPFFILIKLPYDVGEVVMKQGTQGKIWTKESRNNSLGGGNNDIAFGLSNSEATTRRIPYSGTATEMIPFPRIKEIRKLHGVTTTSVIIAAMTGSIRNQMFKDKKKIPRQINFSIPLPLEGHPDKLRNHM